MNVAVYFVDVDKLSESSKLCYNSFSNIFLIAECVRGSSFPQTLNAIKEITLHPAVM